MNLCKCGCKNPVNNLSAKYINGHNSKTAETIQKKKINSLIKYGVESPQKLLEVKEKRKQTCLKKFGEITNLKCQKTKEKIKQTCIKKYGVENPSKVPEIIKKVTIKCKQTRTSLGHWIPDKKRTMWQIYKQQVFHYTNISLQQKYSKEELQKRKASGISKGFHIDHKFSVLEGFNQGILPCIIGCIHNLDLISWEENNKKWARCSITKKELFDLYNQK